MRFYKQPHAFYAGIDLHARSMFTHILDSAGATVFERDLPATPDAFRNAIAPFRAGLVVGVECMFAWYWLADLCEDEAIPFTLGHALYMKAIHGGKAKNDRIDAAKIAGLLRGGMFPMAYVYPRAKRATRDLLRRRCFFVNQRSQLIAHVVNTNSQYNHPPLTARLCYPGNRTDDIAERFVDPATQLSVRADLKLIDDFDAQIDDIERVVQKTAKIDDPVSLGFLRTIPGIGKILSLVMLYEIDRAERFPEVGNFLSYARLVRCEHESAGKKKGSGGKKIGNAHLKWAFSEAACLMLRAMPDAKKWMQRQERKRGKKKALSVLEAKIGRTVYHLLRKQQAFDAKRFFAG
jgi:transposase